MEVCCSWFEAALHLTACLSNKLNVSMKTNIVLNVMRVLFYSSFLKYKLLHNVVEYNYCYKLIIEAEGKSPPKCLTIIFSSHSVFKVLLEMYRQTSKQSSQIQILQKFK